MVSNIHYERRMELLKELVEFWEEKANGWVNRNVSKYITWYIVLSTQVTVV